MQFLPEYTNLVEESVRRARVVEYEGVQVRVVGPEHLVGLALEAGGARRRERAYLSWSPEPPMPLSCVMC